MGTQKNRRDEYPKLMFKLIDKEQEKLNFTQKTLSWTYFVRVIQDKYHCFSWDHVAMKPDFVAREQQRSKPALIVAQSDQRIC